LPGDSFSVATAISDGGQIVGYSYPPYSPPPPPPFQTGNVAAGGLKSAGGTVFGSDATSSYPSYASGINSTGQVVGTSGTSSGAVFPLAGNTCHAFLFNSGAISDLGNLGGSVTAATGINANGSVVGFGTGADGVEHAFLYNGTMNNLGSLGLASTHGFLYNEGGLTDLGVLSGFASSTAAAINASGQAVGTCTDSTGWVMHGFLCKNGAMTDLGTLPGCAGSQALGINANGQVVGCTLTIQTTPPISYLAPASAFLYSAGAMVDLNSLIDPASGWTLTSATAINDSGWIVGNGTNSLGQSHAFLLTPIPEPSTAALAASGLAAVLLAAWRRRKRGR
jgi:probable HAF family extracellular repeat protein